MEQKQDIGLAEEIRQFEKESASLHKILAKTKALGDSRMEKAINISIFTIAALLLILQLTIHPFAEEISLEIGLFLVSFKLILMIHASSRFNHFQFWILHSIETRVNRMADRLDEMEKKLP